MKENHGKTTGRKVDGGKVDGRKIRFLQMGYEGRLEKSFRDAPVIPLRKNTKIVLFSDCHRGVGNANDNFLKNQNLYLAALRHYYESGFLYIELGDGEELWENRKFASIKEIHEKVYQLLSLFQEQGRLCMIYGNHDHEMKDNREFPHVAGVVLKLCESEWEPYGLHTTRCRELYLTHGHQADALNSTFWKLSRFLVRYLWKPLEQVGMLDPTSAAKNYRRRSKSEKRLSAWAQEHDCYLIAGHTHRPTLGNGESHYFNTGSCVHPYGITCLEIEEGEICLVKWQLQTRPDRTLFVGRSVLAGPLSI